MTPPPGFTLVDTRLFQTISKLLTPEQQRAISEAEARRYFAPVLVGDDPASMNNGEASK